MERELKFRAWDGEKMHYNIVPWQWDFVIDTMSHRCVEKSMGSGFCGSAGSTAKMEVPAIRFEKIMQFTGLKDKNENKIYAGDILDCQDRIVTIYWNEKNGQWDSKFIKYQGELCSNGIENINFKYRAEIIGNIHENPELWIP